jgi:hypothetical protein
MSARVGGCGQSGILYGLLAVAPVGRANKAAIAISA